MAPLEQAHRRLAEVAEQQEQRTEEERRLASIVKLTEEDLPQFVGKTIQSITPEQFEGDIYAMTLHFTDGVVLKLDGNCFDGLDLTAYFSPCSEST